ncbi:protoporphyrinogen oxidase [Alicyclobacillus kakegawensis]|uniref:protoporphyrinogen oxidase n=1 Tax=Alicyclobacillus kakegawensis TaxID=392012 RepID=UPI0008318898|nr:protoporphyrinogen oxidase [Alicyclobacillus kakegawensis]
MNERRRVVIVGGGISGLASAFYLKQASQTGSAPEVECVLVESDSRLGGKLLTYREDGFVLEGGPDSMLVRKPAGMALVRALGIESELVPSGSSAQRTYVVSHGRLALLPTGTYMGIPHRWDALWGNDVISARGKWRVLRDLTLPPLADPGDVSVGAFLRRRLGDEWVDRLCEPLLAGIYAGQADALSLDATFPHFRRMELEHGSLILAAAALRRQQAEAAAAHSSRSAFVALRGGFTTLVERLYDELHTWAQLLTQAQAVDLARTEAGYRMRVRLPHGERLLEADAVILSTPAFVTAQLLKPWLRTADHLLSIPYASTATVGLVYRGEDMPRLDASGFLAPRVEHRFITASTWISSKWPHTTPQGYTLIRGYVGRAGDEQGLTLDDPEIIRRVRQELADLTGITAKPVFARLTRWDKSMPQYTVGHLERLAEVEKELAQRLPGVFLTGAGYRGVGIPDCVAQAQTVAEAAATYLKQPTPVSTHSRRATP